MGSRQWGEVYPAAPLLNDPWCERLKRSAPKTPLEPADRNMIHVERVTSAWHSASTSITVLDDVTIELPTSERLAVLGRERSGKTTLIRLLSGLILPTSGIITRYARVSFPAGYMGGYKNALSVRENIAHAARLYGAEVNQVVEFVCELTGLGIALREPYGNVPQLYRQRLAYAVSYAIPFDVYLIDNKIAAGGSEFRRRCEQIFEERTQSSGFILATNTPRYAKRFANKGAILYNGKIVLYNDLERAIWDFDRLGNPLAPMGMGI